MTKIHYASTKDSDMFYMVPVHISDPLFLIDSGDKKYIFLDHREFGVFKEHNTDSRIELVLLNPLMHEARDMSDVGDEVNKLALFLFRKYNLLETPVEVSRHFPLDMADFLRLHGARLNVTFPFLPERMVKSADEIDHIRESIRRTQTAFRRIEDILADAIIEGDILKYEGAVLTSEFLKHEVDHILLKEDMENVERMIISCGEQAAIPHHQGSGPIRPHQTVVCDIFPRRRSNGYFADMTRTYMKGTPTERVQKMYEAVKRAQDKGFEIIKPGMLGRDIHQVCAQVLLDSGFDAGDKGFIHGLGHGLGLDVHELPSAGATSDFVLEPGNVITVEPGLYYPEWGGVRIEDVVVVTQTGCENITQYHRDYVIA